MDENKESGCSNGKHDNCQTVSPWPSVGEALSMTKKLFSDTAKSINEIYGDYKSKRATNPTVSADNKKTDNPVD